MKCGAFIMIKGTKSGCVGLLTMKPARASAFWFGRREHKNLDRLLELLEPLNIGKVYADGN
jgi:hypothetical protein